MTSHPLRQFPTVEQYMSSSPRTVGRSRSLANARAEMHEHKIRHLPVLDGGQIVGVISERDLFLVESFPGVNPTVVRVEEAMTTDVLTVAPTAPVAEVAQILVERKLGSAIVVHGEKVVGVFTTIDALRALVGLLAPK